MLGSCLYSLSVLSAWLRRAEFPPRSWNPTPSCFRWKAINTVNRKRPKGTREWGARKGWEWNLQLFMFVNQDLNFVLNLPNTDVENEMVENAFRKYSWKQCWHRVFRAVQKLSAMSTQPFDQWLLANAQKDPVMREAGLPNAMSRKLPRKDIQNQERVLSWLSDEENCPLLSCSLILGFKFSVQSLKYKTSLRITRSQTLLKCLITDTHQCNSLLHRTYHLTQSMLNPQPTFSLVSSCSKTQRWPLEAKVQLRSCKWVS